MEVTSSYPCSAGRTPTGSPASSTRWSWRTPSEHSPPAWTLLTREFEGGTDILGGQWQRLSVARALVDEEADIVVLDEASSNLDPVAEGRLVHTEKQLCRHKLVVVVSHRLSSIAETDRVLVLDHGRVVESGSPLELLAAEGAFARMFSVQAKRWGSGALRRDGMTAAMSGSGRRRASEARQRLLTGRDTREQDAFNLLDVLASLPELDAERPAHPELVTLFEDDQADRHDPAHLPADLGARDRARRRRVLELLAGSGGLLAPADAYHAAMVLQHGSLAEHYHLGFELARRAADAGHRPARWLAAAAMDRWLVHAGLPQKYGTQYVFEAGRWHVPEIDPRTPDDERAAWDVPSLEVIFARVPTSVPGEW